MADLRLHPSGRLVLDCTEQEAAQSKTCRTLLTAYRRDWRAGLFCLAADTSLNELSLTMRFWRTLAADYLTRLCHLPDTDQEISVPPPGDSQLDHWVFAAPPMAGGEYLSREMLSRIWNSLTLWGLQSIAGHGGLDAFLQTRAPAWNRVGKVVFHLAENTKDQGRPFAFMATFTTGMGAGGQVKHAQLRKALDLYAGSSNRQALIKLLTPVHEAAKRCPWVQQLVDSGHIYTPMAWSAEQAHQLLRSAELLEECGLSVRLPDWWSQRPRPKVNVTIGEQRQTTLDARSMLDFRVGVALGDAELTPEEIHELLNAQDGLVFLKGKWVEVDREKLHQALNHFNALLDRSTDQQISFIEGMRMLAGASRDLKENDLTTGERSWVQVRAGRELRDVLDRLHHPQRLDLVHDPERLKASLRPYQREGVSWLHFLTELGLGACLADDMGLGKTLQVLALLTARHDDPNRKPALLVIPASLLGNWRHETERFTPHLNMIFLHPSETDRAELETISATPDALLNEYDLVITTYSMAHRQPWLADVSWSLVILDEAQAIKNPSTRQSRAVRKIPARARIALTGTPVENRLNELWSLFDFLNPGLLGSPRVFQKFVQDLEKRPQDTFEPLRRLVSPYILRRLKTDRNIMAELPDKTETVRYCTLTTSQIRHYQHTVDAMKKGLQTADEMARRGLVLQTLMRLKQICNHPSQYTGDGEYAPGKSGKFSRIADICDELAQRLEKVLIFTQFREIIPALEDHLAGIFGRRGLVLHGSTQVKKRQALVDQFQDDDGPPFFILSLKAGGTGLNLTAASHVIHFDRWWNPAVENQATDRAFRIGQDRNVLVHTFVTRGTIEERIHQLIQDKKALAEQVLSGSGEVNLTELEDEELLQLLRLDVTRASAAA